MATVLDYLLGQPGCHRPAHGLAPECCSGARRGGIRVAASDRQYRPADLEGGSRQHPHHLAGNVVLVLFVLVGTGCCSGVKIKGQPRAAAVLFCGIALAAQGGAPLRFGSTGTPGATSSPSPSGSVRARASSTSSNRRQGWPAHSSWAFWVWHDPGRRGRGTSPRAQSGDRGGLRQCRHEHTRPWPLATPPPWLELKAGPGDTP